MTKDKNIKTTCNKKSTTMVLPAPTAELVAEITGVSPSYVKKVRTGARPDSTQAAELVKYCNTLLIEGQQILVQAVSASVQKIKPSNK